MFNEILREFEKNISGGDISKLIYYFERHIELDEDEHGPMALEMVSMLAGNDNEKWKEIEEISIEALEKRMSALEAENARLSSRVSQLEKAERIEKKSDFSSIVPKNEIEKKKFFDTFRREIKSSEDQSQGPWTEPASWNGIRKRMSEYGVRQALGRPTRIKPSSNPKIETIYFYSGDLNADGVEEEGYVNLKDKRVVSFKSPHQQAEE